MGGWPRGSDRRVVSRSAIDLRRPSGLSPTRWWSWRCRSVAVTPSTTSDSDGWESAGRSSRVGSIDNGTVRVVARGLIAGGVFLVVNGVLAIVLRWFVIGAGLAQGIEIVGGLVAAFAYWRWSDPKRMEEPRANEDGL